MIESRLDPSVDGIGGGPGDRDLTMADVAVEFRYLATEGRARSVSAVLRIVREQSKNRKKRAELPVFAAVVTFLAATIVVLFSRAPGHSVRGNSVLGSLASLLMVGPLVIVAYADRHRAARNRAQLAELRRLALEVLGVIVDRPGFDAHPLDKEQRKTFGSLRATDPEGWLEVAKALAKESS